MICFLPYLINPGGKNATVDQVADHIVYVGRLIGWSHVGIGSDFDGMLEGPSGLHDTSSYPHLVAELLRRGTSEDHIKQVLGLNIIRVLEEVESCANLLQQASMPALCDKVEPIWTSEQRELLIAKGAQLKEQMSKTQTA